MSFTGMETRGQAARQRRNQAPKDAIEIVKRTDSELLGPDLPRLDGVNWHPLARSWYRDVRRSDIASIYSESQWHTVISAALLRNSILSGIGRNGKPLGHRDFQGYQSELRLQEAALLISPEAQKRMKIVFVDPDDVPKSGFPELRKQDFEAMFAGEEVIST